MTDNHVPIDRRALLGGLGATVLTLASTARAQTRVSLALEAVPGTIVLKPDRPPTPVWQLAGGPDTGPLRFIRGQTVDVTVTNHLSVPVALNWAGLDGTPAAEPLTGQPAIAPHMSASYPITFRHAGTMTADIRVPGDAQATISIGRPLIVSETDSPAFDRDDILVFQSWQLRPDGTAAAAGGDSADAATVFTVNGGPSFDMTATQNQRLRLRLISSCRSTVIAIKIPEQDVRVMAIDSQPCEPFLARDGLVVLTPGSRVDILVDIVKPPGASSPILLLDGREPHRIGQLTTSDAASMRPAPLPMPSALPSNGLPTQLDLRSAMRIDLALGTADWLAHTVLTPNTAPAFKVKRDRTVMIALTNRHTKPMVFHLHGHHFRLLDRLDDGWKPFWLDTLAIGSGQTQRIAFTAEYAGLYPMQAIATDRAAPRFVRSYLVV